MLSGSHTQGAVEADDLAVEHRVGDDVERQRRVFVRAAEPGGEELCSFAPVDVSLLVPAVEPPDRSSLASDPGGAELCSFAPVEVSAPPAAGF